MALPDMHLKLVGGGGSSLTVRRIKARKPVRRVKKDGAKKKALRRVNCPSLSELGQSGGRRRPAGSASVQKDGAQKKAVRRVKKEGKRAGRVRRIDFSKIRWGTFTARFRSWKRRHPRAKVNTLREFAAYVLAHPNKFSLRSRRKALFYRNIILKGKVKMPVAKYSGRKKVLRRARTSTRRAARRRVSRR